jgi:uncharacterized protein YyaL (SSP411 family)
MGAENHLAQETSPYLLQHANNPVAWYPWGQEALDLAKKQNKPILLSIGYSACHWCHVMAHESFEDIETANIMNELFINIKVDREERPDIDKVYQHMHQVLTQQGGGWPLTVFLHPKDQMPFFSGTYFPKEKHHGKPCFKEILNIISHYFIHKPNEIAEQNKNLQRVINSLEKQNEGFAHKIKKSPLLMAKQNWINEFDKINGGFRGAPKFVMPATLSAILYIVTSCKQEDTDKQIYNHILYSLNKICLSGLVDHIDGGFLRYCVDDKWQIPHFEKMLYDNAQMIGLLGQAFAMSKNELFKETIRDCIQWTMLDMQSFEGGFYSSLDADSEGEEGKFYTWYTDDLRSFLDDKEYDLLAQIFEINDLPNFENKWHLIQKKSYLELSTEDRIVFANIKQKLKIERAVRIRPHLDHKLLCSWNALMFKGLSIAGAVLNDAKFSHLATRIFNFIKVYLFFENQLWVSYNKGQRKQSGFLDDYAFLLDACWYYLQINYNNNDLHFAKWLCDTLIEKFWDNENGFYFTSEHHEALIYRPKNWSDDVLPNGAATAALALSRFGVLLNEQKYIEVGTRALQLTQPSLDIHAQYYPTLLNIQAEFLQGLSTVIIYGKSKLVEKARLLLLKHYQLNRFIFAIASSQVVPECFKQYVSEDELSIYFCHAKVCQPPLKSLQALENYLKNS